MQKVLDLIDRVFMGLVITMMGLIVVTIAGDVIGRYGFGKSLLFANELSRLCFIWLSFLVMPLGISKGLHVAITSVLDNVPPYIRSLLFRLGTLAVIVLMGVVFAGAWISIKGRSSEMLNTLPISAAWFYYPLALGSAWSAVHLIVQFFRGRAPQREITEETVQAMP